MTTQTTGGSCRTWTKMFRAGRFALMALCLVTLLSQILVGQVANSTLSGIVYDASGAVVPKAKIVLKNEASNTTRDTVSNSVGFFNFQAVPPGTYTVTISAPGFSAWQTSGITFNQGENRSLPNIALKAGAENTQVEVAASPDQVPVDTGESRTTLNNQMVSEIAITGRNAAELMRIMPGMGMNTGLSQGQWNSMTTSTGSSPVGGFSANGTQPNGGLSMISDGSNIVDPGNQGSGLANINQDMTSEVTILNSAFGAEYAKGPVNFQAISKSGGSQFHGEGYIYARNGALNSWEDYLKTTTILSKQPLRKQESHYYYPGVNVGGPVVIPGLDFNKNHDKLFFFTGYEYMQQHPIGTLHRLVVPTAAMRQGDFSAAQVKGLQGVAGLVPCGDPTFYNYGNWCNNAGIANGNLSGILDPNGVALANLMPLPNADPTNNNGYNYNYLDSPPTNRWEYRAKLDYNITQSTHLSGSYTRQNETDINTFGVWWEPSDTLPYPTSLNAPTRSNSWSFNLTKVFSPTMTSDTTFTYTSYINPVKPADPSKVDPANVGFNAAGIFNPSIMPQIPNLISWGCTSGTNQGCFPGYYAPGFSSGFANGAFGASKEVPSIATNISKVLGTHTTKFGFYWDMNTNNQTSGYGSWGQGAYEFDQWGTYSTSNPLADLLIGHAQSFSQTSAIPVYNARYHQYSFYGQDQWKATRRLTLTYGLRFDHEGQWYALDHPGLAVWNPALYDNSKTAATFTGMTWHNIDKNVPNSGFKSPMFTPSPRVGAAFDLFGNGKTVLRGGYGIYRYQLAYNDIAVANNQPLGIQNITTTSMLSLASANQHLPSSSSSFNGDTSALRMGDDRTPWTESYNVTVSQAAPWKSLVEIQYSGNRSHDMLLAGNGGNVGFYPNLNKIPVGGLFGADPITGVNNWQAKCASSTGCGAISSSLLQDYRPYQNYGVLNVDTHGSYSNYNAFMLSWQKQSGPVTFTTNYTFSKVLGIRDGQTNNGNGDGAMVDPFTLRNNYGVLAFDHTHIFNAAYVIHMPSPIKGNRILGGVVNGWEVSGVTQFQSGAPIQPNTGGNLNAQYNNISNQTVLGTDSITLMPILTCDPRKGTPNGYYFNTACFVGPTAATATSGPAQNGPAIWPYIKGPGYVASDLSLNKNFKVRESQNVQFRISAFNFLNHPLPQFGLGNDIKLFLAPGGTNTNAETTGKPEYKTGQRVLEFALKYQF